MRSSEWRPALDPPSVYFLQANLTQLYIKQIACVVPADYLPITLHCRYILQTYARPNLVFTHGEGARLYDAHGKEYLDFAAGIAVNALGALFRLCNAGLTVLSATCWGMLRLAQPPGCLCMRARVSRGGESACSDGDSAACLIWQGTATRGGS